MADIRKISIGFGNVEVQRNIELGQVVIGKDFKITLIERDDQYAHLTGESRYHIWVQEINKTGQVVGKLQEWMETERQPVTITYEVKKGLMLDSNKWNI